MMEQQNEQAITTSVMKLVNPEEMERMKKDAELLVQPFASHGTDDSISHMLDTFASLGEREQAEAGESIEFLKRPVNQMASGEHDNITKTILELRSCVDDLQPGIEEQKRLKTIVNRLFRKNPVENYLRKYQSVEKQIDGIIMGLLRGKDRIESNTVELEMIKTQGIEKMNALKKQIYFGGELFTMLEQLEKEQEAAQQTEQVLAIRKGMEKVVVRRKDMMTAVAILQQSIAAVDIIKDNNDRLEEAIFNSITMTKNVTTISASINLALADQKTVIDAVNKTNESMEAMLLSNAKLLKSNTEETTRLLEQPSISIEKLREAFSDVYAAIQLTEDSSKTIIRNSQQFIAEIEQLNEEMERKL